MLFEGCSQKFLVCKPVPYVLNSYVFEAKSSKKLVLSEKENPHIINIPRKTVTVKPWLIGSK